MLLAQYKKLITLMCFVSPLSDLRKQKCVVAGGKQQKNYHFYKWNCFPKFGFFWRKKKSSALYKSSLLSEKIRFMWRFLVCLRNKKSNYHRQERYEDESGLNRREPSAIMSQHGSLLGTTFSLTCSLAVAVTLRHALISVQFNSLFG